ncbi:MAG: hypothetical protein RLZZ232_2006, partial [Planctomycetota bacterium]
SRASLAGAQPVDRMGAGTVGEWTIAGGLLADTRATIRSRDPAIAMQIGIGIETGTGIGGEDRRTRSRKLALAVQLWKVMRCH